MAVYTEVDRAEADTLLRHLGLGELVDLQGIRSGIENTNYYAATVGGQWVLTLFEQLPAEQLPCYLRLMQHLAARGIPVPAPQAAPDGSLVHRLAGKPAAVVTRLPGSHRQAPDAGHVAQLGHMLARMHLAAAGFESMPAHPRGLAWWHQTAAEVLPYLEAAQAELLRQELEFQQHLADSPAGRALPHGPIHADLFRDNAMFDDTAGTDSLCGIFDFYFAGTDALLFDIAVCLNDWCIEPAGGLHEPRAQVLVSAYEELRPLTAGEHRALPAMLRAAALRFWISRLRDWHLPRQAHLLQAKDPAHFERLLRLRVQTPWHAAP